MSESKPRVWFIEWFEIDEKEPMIECNVYHIKPKHWPKKPTQGQVEVVGYVAYLALEQRVKELEAIMERKDRTIDLACKGIDVLEAQNKILREAVEKITLYKAYNGDTWPSDIAKEAIAAVGKVGDV